MERMKLLDFTFLDSLLKMSFDYTALFWGGGGNKPITSTSKISAVNPMQA